MLTKAEFDQLPHRKIFASGFAPDSPEGLHMTSSGELLYWVAVKGTINDWAIYCSEHGGFEYTAEYGDKVHDLENVKRVINVDAEVLACYRWR